MVVSLADVYTSQTKPALACKRRRLLRAGEDIGKES